MINKPIKISENCWKHIDKYGDMYYTKTSNLASELHRTNGPAIECSNGDKLWYINGKRHRENGPAIEYTSGSNHWYINGKLHRKDCPAIELFDGHKEWHINGNLHRTDGPAIEYTDGNKFWYLNNNRIHVNSQEEFEIYIKNLIFI